MDKVEFYGQMIDIVQDYIYKNVLPFLHIIEGKEYDDLKWEFEELIENWKPEIAEDYHTEIELNFLKDEVLPRFDLDADCFTDEVLLKVVEYKNDPKHMDANVDENSQWRNAIEEVLK